MAEATEHHQPGELPPIRDEAADTPLWLPVMGLCFLVLGAFALIWQSVGGDEAEAAEVAPTEGAEAAADGEPTDGEGEAADAPAPAEPADDPHAGHGH